MHEAMHRRTYNHARLFLIPWQDEYVYLNLHNSYLWSGTAHHREKYWDSIDAYLHIDHRDVCLCLLLIYTASIKNACVLYTSHMVDLSIYRPASSMVTERPPLVQVLLWLVHRCTRNPGRTVCGHLPWSEPRRIGRRWHATCG